MNNPTNSPTPRPMTTTDWQAIIDNPISTPADKALARAALEGPRPVAALGTRREMPTITITPRIQELHNAQEACALCHEPIVIASIGNIGLCNRCG